MSFRKFILALGVVRRASRPPANDSSPQAGRPRSISEIHKHPAWSLDFRPSALRSPVSSSSGSALILTLLVTALLATIAVSFLSTSRVEQIAAKNFSRQNAATGLAELATQQAMAKIQQGFTINGTGTTVITTQPGAIWQFTFSSGICSAVATKNPMELFSGTGNASTNGTANLNNLQNPSSNSSATTNQFTITGNRSERINVPMENITSNGTVVGRIAYYVDDEGTKLNANSAIGNRTTLNAASRPQDIRALISATQASSFSGIVNGSNSSNSSITGWIHFFRPEQVRAAVSGFSGDDFPFLTTATSSANSTANMTHLLTPWGTQRLFINELSTNATDGTGTASVNTIHSALTNSTLTAIFGQNFADKYTSTGVKQIAANMLQMRSPNTFSVTASFAYNGTILCDSLGSDPNPFDPSQYYFGIPQNYLASVPFPVINEIGCTAVYNNEDNGLRVRLYYWIELFNPYNTKYINNTDAALVFMLDKIQFQTNNTGNTTVGVAQDFREYHRINEDASFNAYGNSTPLVNFSSTYNEPIIRLPDIDPRNTQTIRLEAFTHWLGVPQVGSNLYSGINSNSTTITGNITTRIERILLVANANNLLSVRDAISGNNMGDLIIPPTDISNNSYGAGSAGAPIPVSGAKTFKRVDARYKSTQNGTTTGAFVLDGNISITRSGSSYQDNIVPAPDSTSGNGIPGDPILSNNSTYLLSSNNSSADKLEPVLVFPAFSSPADLGKVPTNTPYRSLRMQMQPASEGSRIPDWAMLDVISFGNSTNPNNAFNRMLPVNINGRFRLPGNATIAPRTIGVKALAQVLSYSGNSSIQDPTNPTSAPALLTADETKRFKGNTANATTIANAIGNMTWSANSTWGNATTGKRWKINGAAINTFILPSEIMEIDGVADAVLQGNYTNSSSHFKWNEGRASAFIPAVTTRSSCFMIYAYAQALDISGNIDSEALTKTMVEVQYNSGNYSLKKLYTQPIPLGQ